MSLYAEMMIYIIYLKVLGNENTNCCFNLEILVYPYSFNRVLQLRIARKNYNS